MTDKQQIEYIAMELYNNQDKIDVTNLYEVADLIYKAGYRKVDENHIVIPLDGSKMVIPRKDQQKLLHAMYEQGKFDAIVELQMEGKIVITQEDYDDLVEENTNIRAELMEVDLQRINARKETAKEIINEIKRKYGKSCSEYYPLLIEITSEELDDLAKQFGVEVE